MRAFRDLSIQLKLTLIIMATTTAALLLACAAFVAYELITFREAMTEDLLSTATIIGSNSKAALAFNDQKAAGETLAALIAEQHIVSAGIYAMDGKLFAQYRRNHRGEDCPPNPLEVGHWFEDDHLVLFQPIVLDGERIGTVYIKCDLEQLHHRLEQYASIVTIVIAASILVGLLLSSRLQRVISKPILYLAQIARVISHEKNYSVRAVTHSQDELGELIGAFNEMLTQIQQRDVALRQSEEHFRSLIENASDIIIIVNGDGTIRYGSPSTERVLGYTPEDLIGKYISEFVVPDEAANVMNVFTQTIQNPGTTPSIEFGFRHQDGSWRVLEAICNSRLDNSGVAGVVINSRDTTERKRAEEALKRFAGELERSNNELQEFAYVASHDLQEPLRKIQAFGDRLKAKCGETLSDQGRDYLERMQNAARRMQTLINDLLTFSRVTTQAQPFVPVDLAEVVREVVSDLEVRLEQTGGRVEIGALPIIDADRLQMRQLLQNLIGNALKFHRVEEPPVVKVCGQLLNGQDRRPVGNPSVAEMCQIVVEDNGIGFDEKYRDRIFAVFQRLHSRSDYEGTGIGLAVCQKIAKRHGGSITARSTVGQGSTFIVMLPVNQLKDKMREETNHG